MLQAAFSDCLCFDLLSHFQDFRATPVIDVSGCQVCQTLVVSLIVVVVDERVDLALQIAGQIIVFQKNSVFHGLVPSLDFALGLRVVWRTAYVIHALFIEIVGQIGMLEHALVHGIARCLRKAGGMA